MFRCPVCEKKISKDYVSCPYCEAKIDRENENVTISMENLAKTKRPPIYMHYIVIAILTMISIVALEIPDILENSLVGRYGINSLAALSGAKQAIEVVFSCGGVILMAVVMFAITGYILLKKIVKTDLLYLGFAVLVVLTFYGLFSMTRFFLGSFVSQSNEAYGMGVKFLNSMISYFTLLVPVYIMISHYSFCRLGVGIGLFVAFVNLTIMIIVHIVRVPLVLLLGFDNLYLVIYPLIADVLMGGFTFIMCFLKR